MIRCLIIAKSLDDVIPILNSRLLIGQSACASSTRPPSGSECLMREQARLSYVKTSSISILGSLLRCDREKVDVNDQLCATLCAHCPRFIIYTTAYILLDPSIGHLVSFKPGGLINTNTLMERAFILFVVLSSA